MVIFVESAALSTISKVIQISISSATIASSNPIFIPLCSIASNLIIIRKALGVDVVNEIRTTSRRNLSPLRFRSRAPQTEHDSRNLVTLESFLIHTVGGRTLFNESHRETRSDADNEVIAEVEGGERTKVEMQLQADVQTEVGVSNS